VIVTSGEDLRSAIAQRWRVDVERITVIAPPVDRALFAPADRQEARRRLGLAPDQLILVAGDGLGAGSDLGSLIEAVQHAGDPSLQLHVLGDGERRVALERLAGPGGAVRFHGQLLDDHVAAWIAAADLCVLVDEHGESAFTVRECLAAGRPVAVVVPGDRTHAIIRHRVTGFLVANDLVGWIRFLQADCHSRKALHAMGLTASKTPLESLDQAATAYLDVIHRVRTGAPTPAAIA
jgi:glycosyltransferase involved in cell wall biosynthesis